MAPTATLKLTIRDRFVTVIKAIVAGDDYFYKPFAVEERFMSHEELKGDPAYFVFIGESEDPVLKGAPDNYEEAFVVLIGCWVKDMSDPTEKALKCMKDITKAIDTDSRSGEAGTLGTLATQTMPLSFDTMKGNFSSLGFEWFERRFRVLIQGTFDEL